MTTQESSAEIRRDIEATRNNMGETVDAIQDRLDPRHLRDEAQATIRDTLSDGADTVIEYVETYRGELTSSVVDAVKRNPIPSLMVGVGVGWLLLDALSSSPTERTRYPVQRYRGGYPGGQPYGRAAAGAGYDSAYAYGDYRYVSDGGRVGGEDENWAQEMVHTAQDKAADAAETVREKAAEAGDAVRNKAADMGDIAQEEWERARDEARARGERWTDWADDSTSYYRDRAQEMGDTVQERAAQMGDQAQRYAQRAGYEVQQTVNDNPLVFAAVAFGVGTLVAMLMPETRQENEWMGDASDRVADVARGAAQDVAQRAQHVVDEVAPEVQRAAQQVTDEVKQAGRETVDDIKQTGKEAATRVQDKTKSAVSSEAEKAKQDLKKRAEEGKEAVQEETGTRGSTTKS
ncbi:MAG: DUF3618 domain-containing protein [Caldilineaceae bacterium]|nr:DUF3618 domain-containing protein [Caldilineaceae bacterium]MCB9160361.1 DUF3618 domain-containing protein [Caldilineaceae bacterium]